MSISHTRMLESANTIFVVIYLLEMLLKSFGLGIKAYCLSIFNLFDAFLVIVSFVEIGLSEQTDSNLSALVVLRGLRVFRVLKLASTWESLQNLLLTVIKAIFDIGSLAFVCFILLFVFTIFGAALFANKFKFNENDEYDPINGKSPRTNFDSLTSAFTSVFIVV